MNIKRKLMVDIDTERKNQVIINNFQEHENQKIIPNPVLDMSIFCEAVCTLIHLCEQEGIKSSADSLRDCIKHLKDGFSEAGYKGRFPDDVNTEKGLTKEGS